MSPALRQGQAGPDPGGVQGGGVLGVRTPPPFMGTPKLHKEGENVALVRANEPRFSS